MTYVKAYVGTLVAFLLLDGIWLGLIARQYYARQIGELMRESPLWPAAAVFYLAYIGGIVVLAVHPALHGGTWRSAALYGAVLGAVAYAAYDLTNLATLKGWPVGMVVVDIAWGTFLTAVTAVAGLLAARAGS